MIKKVVNIQAHERINSEQPQEKLTPLTEAIIKRQYAKAIDLIAEGANVNEKSQLIKNKAIVVVYPLDIALPKEEDSELGEDRISLINSILLRDGAHEQKLDLHQTMLLEILSFSLKVDGKLAES